MSQHEFIDRATIDELKESYRALIDALDNGGNVVAGLTELIGEIVVELTQRGVPIGEIETTKMREARENRDRAIAGNSVAEAYFAARDRGEI